MAEARRAASEIERSARYRAAEARQQAVITLYNAAETLRGDAQALAPETRAMLEALANGLERAAHEVKREDAPAPTPDTAIVPITESPVQMRANVQLSMGWIVGLSLGVLAGWALRARGERRG